MISVKIEGIEALKRSLGEQQKQLRFAAAKSLTQAARKVETRLRQNIADTFDRPTPWIKNGTFVEPAKKDNLVATVGIKDQGARATQAKYLLQHFTAGARSNKPMEKAMRSMGILPSGWLAIPSKDGVKTDSYGNVSKRTIAGILGALQRKETARNRGLSFRLFVVAPGNNKTRLHPGIWQAASYEGSSTVKPVFLFVQAARYRKVLDLEKTAREIVDREFGPIFNANLMQALRTAR